MNLKMYTIGLIASASLALAATGDDLIVNGNFSGGVTSWNLNVTGDTAKGTIAVGADSALAVSVTAIDAANYHVQLQQSGLSFIKGHKYTLSFDATATTDTWAFAELDNTSPWGSIAGQAVQFTATKQTFTISFTDTVDVAAGLFQISLGGAINTITIDNVKLIDNGVPAVVNTSEKITNGNFSTDTIGWKLNITGDTAKATMAVATDTSLLITITAVDAANYHIQLQQSGLTFTKGHKYTFSFDAKASASIWAYAELDNTSPWGAIFGQSVNITTSKKTFSYSFTDTVDVTVGMLQFSIGNGVGTVSFDNISVIDNGVAVVAVLDTVSGLLKNGTFSTGDTTGWKLNVTGDTAKATAIVDANGALAIAITAVDAANYHIHLQQSGFSLVKGHKYTLSFDAVALAEIYAYAELDNTSPFGAVFAQSPQITTTKKTFTYTFTDTANVAAAMLQFSLGNAVNTITIDNVKLKDVTPVVATLDVASRLNDIQITRAGDAMQFRSANGQVAQAQIFDLTGRSLAQASATNGTLSLTNLDKGIYVIQVRTALGKKTIKFNR